MFSSMSVHCRVLISGAPCGRTRGDDDGDDDDDDDDHHHHHHHHHHCRECMFSLCLQLSLTHDV
jgi:hypothetical protein